ncbi:CRISPR-associated protein Csx20 [Desulfosoma sp.]|uniref:CRISPR-associated protein Csx20 n=1 Tax=Desulfosoma sp. TaxID=2603217 RepID=UPI00404B75D0
MAKVFLSPLGTNAYVECYYELDGKPSEHPVVFVQEALVAHICRDWTPQDRILIACTAEAEKKNWIDGGNFPQGLESRMRQLNLKAPCQKITIPEGRNEEEIMSIFMILMEALQEGDHLYLDITHSFRSLPLLQTVIVNYAKVLKNIEVERILYGAFETLGPVQAVRDMPLEKRVAPVFDLTPYDALVDWARAVDIFHKAGRPQEIRRLVGRNLGPIFAQRKNPDERALAQALSGLSNRLNDLCLNLAAARGQKIAEARGLDAEIDAVENQRLIPPLRPLLEIVRRKLQGFNAADPETKGFEAAKWCLDHELIPQAYVFLRETVLSALCRAAGHDPLDENMRENFWAALLHVLASGKRETEWSGLLAQRREDALNLIGAGGSELMGLAHAFEPLRHRRNDLLHGGWKKDASTAQALIDFLRREGLQELRRAWESYRNKANQDPNASNQGQEDTPRRAFWLLSHKPTPEQEKELFTQWHVHAVMRLPDPLQSLWSQVPPEDRSVRSHLKPILEWLENESAPGDVLVVQGEFGATFGVASWALGRSMVPVYATSERIMEESVQPDGSVLQKRIFRHVRFRPYES